MNSTGQVWKSRISACHNSSVIIRCILTIFHFSYLDRKVSPAFPSKLFNITFPVPGAHTFLRESDVSRFQVLRASIEETCGRHCTVSVAVSVSLCFILFYCFISFDKEYGTPKIHFYSLSASFSSVSSGKGGCQQSCGVFNFS